MPFYVVAGCSGVKEVVSAGPVWVAASQEAEIHAVQAGQVPPVQGVLSAMWNFMSTLILSANPCMSVTPSSFLSYKSSKFGLCFRTLLSLLLS